MQPAIAYCRVSTQRQGRSGLGLEAQNAAIQQFAQSHGYAISQTFVEVETGKGSDVLDRRPQLAAAMKLARKGKATILIAKLDRLSRDVHFISGLMAHKVRFAVAELGPNADPFMLHIYAAVAEQERKRISDRTKDALAAAKARGQELGNPALAEANKAEAMRRARKLRPIMRDVEHLSARAAARVLDRRQIPTRTGAPWSYKTVQRVRERLKRGL
jgi:DNA invertase Pin-like site-specific DNA recombinase